MKVGGLSNDIRQCLEKLNLRLLEDEEVEIEIALVKRSGRRVRYETVVRKVACGTVCVDGFALALLPE